MDIRIVNRPVFHICGYTTETTLEGNDGDIAALYRDFFETGKEHGLLCLSGCRSGYYGLEWYAEGHNSFFYLLGKAVNETAGIPTGSTMKHIPAARYAVADVPAGRSLVEAWTAFFYTAIPEAGYAPDAGHGFYFEYYPEDVHGRCELWTPVLTAQK